MTEPQALATNALSELPPRHRIAELYLADEARLVEQLIAQARFSPEEQRKIGALATTLVHAAREGRRQFGGIDAFMHEYGLTSEEGVILMCLAEALLRIPDAETADRLIAEKIAGGDWQRHLGHSDSFFVNASTWGLMLTGRVIDLQDSAGNAAAGMIKRLVARSGEPIIREAMRHAMRILGKQFVFGRTISEALDNAKPFEEAGCRFSFDMLGEAARTTPDARRYFERYEQALAAVAARVGPPEERDDATLFARPSLSIKLSALHPRFEPAKEDRVRRELGPQLIRVARMAREHWLGLTVDAEEADRLELSLQLFADALADPALDGWNGFGLAVQAYGKRVGPVLDWLSDVARASGKRLPLRLVKGAYWDSEIKFAQQEGLAGYPVFTRKANTDISYLASARTLLARPECFFPQFATHNAHTIAAIVVLADGGPAYELQRLHGMGQALYEEVIPPEKLGVPTRIYAPVGGHEDLLAYLVRRLLENGANTSFVHRIADDEAPVEEIVADPVERIAAAQDKVHPLIPPPREIFGSERRNSQGLPLWERTVRLPLLQEMKGHAAEAVAVVPLVGGEPRASRPAEPVQCPFDRRLAAGTCVSADAQQVGTALDGASEAARDWDRLGGAARAECLARAADLFEANHARLMAVMVKEAGKTLANALGDVREAVDFLRYYASEARRSFDAPRVLPGPTGERNELTLHGRGVFACIAPWNFPLAIFTGQVAAALAAGNAVAAKPAEQTPITGYLAVRLLHEAGVPGDVLQFLPGPGEQVGAALVRHPRTAGVAFTGSNETAALIQRDLAERPGPIVPLIAETGGINAMIVDSTALPEQVVRDAVRSAFDSAGQRCSALRVLFVQEDVADTVATMLCGAMEELTLGDPMDYATDVGPVIDEEAAAVLEAHKMRMRAEATELIDLPLPEACRNGCFVSPAAYEIESLSVLEREVFGPILHVIRFGRDELGAVCDAVNATGYGLTLGIHTRNEATADFVGRRARVGNVYVNRDQIGAVVGVQPFGGEGLSGTGPKAGGPNYLARFAIERVRTTDITAAGGNAALLSLAPERKV
ncbi:MAG: bifunctional proline dehydrogenase/L-glutamate gamma-semialdehyde dehydrogenase PutA [Methyloligellaceae bacterium]